MIWDKLSPVYDFFENVYNGKCYKGIAENINLNLNFTEGHHENT